MQHECKITVIDKKCFTDYQEQYLAGRSQVRPLSILQCGRRIYHVSVAEVDEQDTHQIIVIGVVAIVPHNAMADSLMDDISLFVEENTEAEIIDEEREIR